MIDDSFISTDAGNGWAACYQLVKGKIRQHGIPHVRARVTGDQLKADMGGQNIVEYADFMGQRYGYGDGIWNLTNAPVDTHQNTARRYGSPYHIFLILVNIAGLGVKSGSELTVIVPAPPGLLNQVAPQIKQALRAGENGSGDGVWHIQLRLDKKPREYKIVRVICVPEGAGAYAAYRFNLNGDPVELPDANGDDVLAGRVAIVDLGAGTGDVYEVYNGNLNADAISHATDQSAGIIHNVLKPVLGDLVKAVPQATHMTTAHIDSVLRRYLTATTDNEREAAATLRVSGKTINLEGSILAACDRYGEWIAANKLDPLFASGVDAIVMAGGGWMCTGSFIEKMYTDRLILTPGMFKHTRTIALHDLNGVGQLAMAAAAMKAQQV